MCSTGSGLHRYSGYGDALHGKKFPVFSSTSLAMNLSSAGRVGVIAPSSGVSHFIYVDTSLVLEDSDQFKSSMTTTSALHR